MSDTFIQRMCCQHHPPRVRPPRRHTRWLLYVSLKNRPPWAKVAVLTHAPKGPPYQPHGPPSPRYASASSSSRSLHTDRSIAGSYTARPMLWTCGLENRTSLKQRRTEVIVVPHTRCKFLRSMRSHLCDWESALPMILSLSDMFSTMGLGLGWRRMTLVDRSSSKYQSTTVE